MSEAQEPTEPRQADRDSPPKSLRGRHPAEEGELAAPPAVPEDEEIVPNRHSASAEAAMMRWRETHDES
jgi:hypothetical protein